MKKNHSNNRKNAKRAIFQSFAVCAMALGTITFSGCTEVFEYIDPTVPVFTEIEELTYSQPNTVQELDFEANMPWTIVSSEIWCQFVGEDGEMSPLISGEPGKTKLKIKVTDEGITTESKDDATAVLSLIINDNKSELTRVNRLANGYLFQLIDEEGNALEENVVKVGYDADHAIPFTVKANFPFIIKSFPKWIYSFSMVGAVGHEVSASLRLSYKGDVRYALPAVAAEGVPEELLNDEIVFSNGKNEEDEDYVEFILKVQYDGLPEDLLIVKKTPANTNINKPENWYLSRKDWQVTLAGNAFTQKNVPINRESKDVEKFGQLLYQVYMRNDAAKAIYLEKNAGKYEIKEESWMTVSGEKDTYALQIEKADAAREGAVVLLPKQLYENNKTNLEAFIFDEDGTLNQDVYRKYVLAELSQSNFELQEPAAFKVLDNNGAEVALQKVTDLKELVKWEKILPNKEKVYTFVQTADSYVITHDEAWRIQLLDVNKATVSPEIAKAQKVAISDRKHSKVEFFQNITEDIVFITGSAGIIIKAAK